MNHPYVVILHKQMKSFLKILLFILFLYPIISAYSQEKDSTPMLFVSLEKDTIPYKANLIFENISNDTILLFSNFKNFFTEFETSPGFRILFYRNHKLVLPTWGELPKKNYSLSGGWTIIPPKESVTLDIELPPFGWASPKKDIEYGIELELNYRCINMKNRIAKQECVKINYIILDY
jgi:hypothetical protein